MIETLRLACLVLAAAGAVLVFAGAGLELRARLVPWPRPRVTL
jgi:hypothetical protein